MCFSMYSLMSRRTMACSESKRNSARARASSVLPTPVGPRKMKEPSGRLGSWRPERARRTALLTACDGLLLAHDSHAQALFHVQELLLFALEEPGDRDAGPFGHHFGHVFGVHLFLEHGAIFLHFPQLPVFFFQLLFQVEHDAISDFRGPGQISQPLGLGRVDLGLLHLLLDGLDAGDDVFFLLPAGLEGGALFLEVGELLFDLGQALLRGLVLLPL